MPPQSEVMEALGRLTQVSVGDPQACGLLQDGALRCFRGKSNPEPGTTFSWATSGKEFACGLRDDGTILCWGENIHGNVDAPEGRFVKVDAGKRHACALDERGDAVCWGWDENGRARAPSGETFVDIQAGGTHSCGLTQSGALLCWGNQADGRSVSRIGPYKGLAVGEYHTCALRMDGAAFCQGVNEYGESNPPQTVFTQISAGDAHTCGLAATGDVECWGIGATAAPSAKFTSVSVGKHESCAIRMDGYVECWRHRDPSPEEIAFLDRILSQPVEMFAWPSGGVAVVDRIGHITAYPLEGEPRRMLDLTAETYCCSIERGMLSAALDPQFDDFPFIYIYYQVDEADDGEEDYFRGRLARFPIDGDSIAPEDALVILDLKQKGANHFGGAVRFGADGMLYLGLGENAEADAVGDPQSLQTLNGKIIRIDVRGATRERPYRIPNDNPFAATPHARAEIWAYGLRNPWRMDFDRAGRLWVGDVGGDDIEELSVVTTGANLGYPLFEGDLCLGGNRRCADLTEAVPPAVTYKHVGRNCAIIAGTASPWPDSEFIFGDFCSGRVWIVSGGSEEGWRMREIADLPRYIFAFGTDENGEVYALTRLGPAVRLEKPE